MVRILNGLFAPSRRRCLARENQLEVAGIFGWVGAIILGAGQEETAMPHGKVREVVGASRGEVFALLHDYGRRLEWDTLLAAAYLTDGYEQAELGAVSVCQGKRRLGGLALKTRYIVFKPGEVAAIKMVNRPLFFETFAATIRHGDVAGGNSWVEYTFEFTARPKWLRWVLHPVMGAMFRRETRKRLGALRRHFETEATIRR